MSILIGGRPLPCVISTKCLGVIIDQHLTWQCHIEYILNYKRICTKLFDLHHLKPLPNSLLATFRPEPIMLLELPIMCLSIIPKTNLSCSKLCF